jgi:hypothetical protein
MVIVRGRRHDSIGTVACAQLLASAALRASARIHSAVNVVNHWDILGLAPTADQRAIKRAYAKLLKVHRPDTNPEGYQELRASFDEAIGYARRNADDAALAERPALDEFARQGAERELATSQSLHAGYAPSAGGDSEPESGAFAGKSEPLGSNPFAHDPFALGDSASDERPMDATQSPHPLGSADQGEPLAAPAGPCEAGPYVGFAPECVPGRDPWSDPLGKEEVLRDWEPPHGYYQQARGSGRTEHQPAIDDAEQHRTAGRDLA